MKEEGRGGGSVQGSDLDLDPDQDPWKILWIRIRQNDGDPLDSNSQHWFNVQCSLALSYSSATPNIPF